MIFSSGSVRRYGRNLRSARSQWRQWSSAGVGEQRLRALVVDRGPLEARRRGAASRAPRAFSPQLRDERAARGVGHVGGEVEVRVVERRASTIASIRSRSSIASASVGRVERRDLAVVALAERGRGGLGLGDVGFDARVVAAGVEIREVPRDLFGAGQLDVAMALET